MTRWGARARLAAWIALLTATLAAVTAAGGGALAAPPLTSGAAALERWYDGREPAEAVAAVLRVVVLALGWYLLGTTVASAALRLARAAPGVRAVDALTLPAVRRLVEGAVGLSLAAGALAAAGTLRAPAPPPAAASVGGEVTMRRVAGDGDVVMVRVDDDGGDPDTMTMRRVDPAAPPRDGAAPPPAAAKTWIVRPGDHLWGIAEQVLTAHWGRHPTDGETDPYWRRLVEHNRPRLADPTNPDLVFPGDVLEVPPPPPPPSG